MNECDHVWEQKGNNSQAHTTLQTPLSLITIYSRCSVINQLVLSYIIITQYIMLSITSLVPNSQNKLPYEETMHPSHRT